jgi:acylphosphatase
MAPKNTGAGRSPASLPESIRAGIFPHVTSKGFLVRGRVQGVGFRWWTARQARALGLSGSVRNLLDGAVEVHVSGDPDAVSELRARLGHGPRTARVEAVAEIPPQPVQTAEFVILQ